MGNAEYMGFLNKFYYISIELVKNGGLKTQPYKNGERGKMLVGNVNNQLGHGC